MGDNNKNQVGRLIFAMTLIATIFLVIALLNIGQPSLSESGRSFAATARARFQLLSPTSSSKKTGVALTPSNMVTVTNKPLEPVGHDLNNLYCWLVAATSAVSSSTGSLPPNFPQYLIVFAQPSQEVEPA